MVFALPLFGSEIAPRFDCAEEFLLATVEEGEIIGICYMAMEEENLIQRIKNLSSRKVDTIICSSIDDFSLRMLNGLGIKIVPWTTGNAWQALERFLASGKKEKKKE